MGDKGIEITSSTFWKMEDRKGKPYRGAIRYRTEDGKLHRTTKVFRGVKSDRAAKKAMDEWKDELKAKLLAESKTTKAEPLTVWQCVDSYIDSSLAGGFIEASTATDYRMTARRIRATLPNMPLDDLTPDYLNKWQVMLADPNGEWRYVHSTVKKTRNVLRVAIQDAINNGRTTLTTNPVITTRKTIAQKRRDKATAPKLNALDNANRTKLLEELDGMTDTSVTIAARLALFAGLREAEISALRWEDIDLDEGFVIVDKAIGKADSGLYIKPQKNDDTEREIPMRPALVEALKRWRQSQTATAEALGIDIDKTFVIGDPSQMPPAECFTYLVGTDRNGEDGKLLGNATYPTGIYQPARLSREWRTLARSSKARGMLDKPVTFHNLRHSFGFYCANTGGIELEQLAKWMGHGDTATTKKYYVAKDRERERATSRAAMDGMTD